MKLAVKFYQKTFHSDENESSKGLYDRVNSWIARHIIKKVEIGETFWRVEKVPNADLPTFRLELYALLDAEESTKGFCDRCREFHSAFYLNQQYNCDACNYTAFKKQMNDKLRIKKGWRKQKMDYIVNELE